MTMLTTSEAAKELGVTVQRVHQLITEGSLPAQKVGRDYIIQDGDLKLVSNRRPAGRPPKQTSAKKPSSRGAKK
jgi:excisionase family DNA binding protein